ncbi:MAG TPA: glycosyltransferase family 39 protein [Blastocatellia bacterium]|nr:glycosyltransferase family 39 protein [Blastocatellia bacterium]
MNLEFARQKAAAIAFVLAVCYGSFYLGNAIVESPNMGLAVLVGLVPAAICGWLILREGNDTRFLLRLLLLALCLRGAVALWIDAKGLQGFFGGDALSFDFFGNALADAWRGKVDIDAPWLRSQVDLNRSGWGMPYYVGSIYYFIGRNSLAVQLINSALGAATCVIVYKIALIVYPERRVARFAAVLTAVSPSMIIWSAQALKDAPIVFCLAMCMYYALKLRDRLQIRSVVLLLVFLVGLYSLRHYAAYIVFIATAGTLIFSARRFTPVRVLQGGALVIVIGLAFAYFGAGEVAQTGFDLRRLQNAREWSAQVSKSGYGGEVDITDPAAALGFLPVGVLYVLLAPFPWMITNLRQLITLPELLIWWAMIPFMLKGYWHSIKHRLREAFGICVFTIGLTLAYALFQSNVGTAYRHRAQLFGFFFVFISIGLELRRVAKTNARARPMFNRPADPGTPVPIPLASKPFTPRAL